MNSQFEAIRKDMLRQVQARQLERTEQLRKLEQQKAKLEDEDLPLHQASMRASNKIPEHCCPRCWVWDGKVYELLPQPGTNEVDLFLCKNCGETYEQLIDK